jgi:hypothetical protein
MGELGNGKTTASTASVPETSVNGQTINFIHASIAILKRAIHLKDEPKKKKGDALQT